MRIIKGKEKEYKDWYDKNSDGYSRACSDYAERWAELLEAEIDKSNDVMKCWLIMPTDLAVKQTQRA